MRECKCGSYAINDDPEKLACDKCWRDAKIERLRAEIRQLMAERDGLRAAICRFLTEAGKTPPWESAGCVWVGLLMELNKAICPEEEPGDEDLLPEHTNHPPPGP